LMLFVFFAYFLVDLPKPTNYWGANDYFLNYG